MKRPKVRVFGAAVFTVISVGMLGYFLWNVAIDTGLSTFTSLRVFAAMILVSAIASLPFTVPTAVLCGLVAATLVARGDASRFRGRWLLRGLKWGGAIGAALAAILARAWLIFTALEFDRIVDLAVIVPLGAFLGAVSGLIIGVYCERILDTQEGAA